MRAFVIYDSKFGNTGRIAQAIGRGMGPLAEVRLVEAGDAGTASVVADPPDLLLLGGPTQRRHASPALRAVLDALPTDLAGLCASAFDTRYRGATLVMGSAAADAGKALRQAGGRLVAPPESFYIKRAGSIETQGLEPGELKRAEQWGRSVVIAAAGSRA